MKREKKQKPYNPFVARTVKRATVGRVKCYLRAVKPNPFNKYGDDQRKMSWLHFNTSLIYYYEIGANDGSYRKETDKDKALAAFENLVKFEKRQTEIN